MKHLKSLIASIALLSATLVGCGGTPSVSVSEGTSLLPPTSSEESINPSSEEISAESSEEASEESSEQIIESSEASISTSSEEESSEEKDDVMNVLFLGNSLMFFNDLPKMVQEMGTIAGKKIYTDSVTQGSATIALFADSTTDLGIQARKKIYDSVEWDYIVISPSRRASPWEDTVYNAEVEAALKIYEMAEEVEAKLLIYSVWGNNTGNLDIYTQTGASTSSKTGNKSISRKEHVKFLHAFGEDIAEKVDAEMIEAGYAFENALAEDPNLELYYSDDKHPSLAGSYLAALTVFGTIFKETNAYMSYDKGLEKAALLKDIANKTCLEGLVPDLESEEAPVDTSFKLLCIGSNYMSDYSVGKMFTELCKAADNIDVTVEFCLDGAYTNKKAYNENDSYGKSMRTALAKDNWDAVAFQITRRCSKSATDVEESEYNNLKAILADFFSDEDAPAVYIYAMNSEANPSIFYDDGGNYSKTGRSESYTAKVGTEYFEELATDKWSDCGLPILYGTALIDYMATYTSSPTNAEKGYIKACCFYMSIFQKEIPEDCKYYYSLSETTGEHIREIVANVCLG